MGYCRLWRGPSGRGALINRALALKRDRFIIWDWVFEIRQPSKKILNQACN
jgi:hypothetical protein